MRRAGSAFHAERNRAIADVYAKLGSDASCRSIVLCSSGKHFCAGADFGDSGADGFVAAGEGTRILYREALRVFDSPTVNGSTPSTASMRCV